MFLVTWVMSPARLFQIRGSVVYTPGSRYAYSGGGYEIVQALIEARSGEPFSDALRDLVFRPLGMADSTWVVPELAAGGIWSTPSDLAKLLIEIARAYRGEKNALITRTMAIEMLTRQNGGPDGFGGAVAGAGRSLVLMKRGQNIGCQAYMLIFPETGQGIVVMSGSDNGTTLATAAASVYGWPPLGELAD